MDTEKAIGLRHSVLALISLIILLGLSAQWAFSKPYYVGVFNDDACLVLSAFAISGGGRCLVCHQKRTQGREFQPGWPVLLAPLSYLAGDRLEAYRCLALFLTLASAVALGLVARRYFGFAAGALAAAALLLSGGALWLGRSTMSEPIFVFLICALLLLSYSDRRVRVTAMICALAAWCAITRTEGLAVPAALVLSYGLDKRWRPAVAVASSALALKVAMTIVMPKPSPHLSQIAQFFSSGPAVWAYLTSWISQQSRLLSDCFLGSADGPWVVLSFALSVLVVGGWWKWWRQDPGFAPWLGLALPLALFLWPYLHLRYWYALLPLWILGLAFALPPKARLGGLALVVVIQLFNASPPPNADSKSAVALYSALRQTPENAVITCLYDCRAHLYSHRATVPPSRANSLAELAAFMASAGSDYVLWENDHQMISDVRGGHQAIFLPTLPLWLENSPIFEVIARTPAGVVAKLRPSRASVTEAFQLYRQSFLVTDQAERMDLLQRCQTVVPGFPGASVLWAQAAVATAGTDRREIRRALVEHGERYPFDFPSVFETLPLLSQLGDPEAARILAQRSRAEALRLGLRAEESALTRYLDQSPSQDPVRPDKGGARRGDERPAP